MGSEMCIRDSNKAEANQNTAQNNPQGNGGNQRKPGSNRGDQRNSKNQNERGGRGRSQADKQSANNQGKQAGQQNTQRNEKKAAATDSAESVDATTAIDGQAPAAEQTRNEQPRERTGRNRYPRRGRRNNRNSDTRNTENDATPTGSEAQSKPETVGQSGDGQPANAPAVTANSTANAEASADTCLLYTSPSPRDS